MSIKEDPALLHTISPLRTFNDSFLKEPTALTITIHAILELQA